MARTWTKAGLAVHAPNDTHLNLTERRLPEGASQVFKAGALLSIVSGLVVEHIDPTTAKIAGVALDDGQNTTAGTVSSSLVLLTPEWELYANVLTSSAADYVLLAADVGKSYDFAVEANYPSTGARQWYLQNTTTDVGGAISQLISGNPYPSDQGPGDAAIGDTNARVRVRVLASARHAML